MLKSLTTHDRRDAFPVKQLHKSIVRSRARRTESAIFPQIITGKVGSSGIKFQRERSDSASNALLQVSLTRRLLSMVLSSAAPLSTKPDAAIPMRRFGRTAQSNSAVRLLSLRWPFHVTRALSAVRRSNRVCTSATCVPARGVSSELYSGIRVTDSGTSCVSRGATASRRDPVLPTVRENDRFCGDRMITHPNRSTLNEIHCATFSAPIKRERHISPFSC